MSLFKQFATNAEKVNEGVPMTFAANEDGSVPTFFISRMAKQNKRYQKVAEAKFRPHQRAINNGTLSNEKSDELMLDIFVEGVLVSWENVQDENGKAITTKEGIVQLFKLLPDLHAELEQAAKEIGLFRTEELEVNSGN